MRQPAGISKKRIKQKVKSFNTGYRNKEYLIPQFPGFTDKGSDCIGSNETGSNDKGSNDTGSKDKGLKERQRVKQHRVKNATKGQIFF